MDSLWMSKLRYGHQLCARVGLMEEEKKNNNMKLAQIAKKQSTEGNCIFQALSFYTFFTAFVDFQVSSYYLCVSSLSPFYLFLTFFFTFDLNLRGN